MPPKKPAPRKATFKKPTRLTPIDVEAMVSDAIRRDALEDPAPAPFPMPQPFTDQWIQAHSQRVPIIPDTRPIPWTLDTPILSTRRWLATHLERLAKWVAP